MAKKKNKKTKPRVRKPAVDPETERMLKNCIAVAKKSGSPDEQIENLMQPGYIPLKWQWSFHAAARAADEEGGPVDIGAGGARGPGKSHGILAQVGFDDCQRVEGLKCLFLRQTGASAKESFEDLVNKVIIGHISVERTANSLYFPQTGSRVILGGFKNENDIDKYVGVEYDVIIIEELNQLTQEKVIKLRGSLRSSKIMKDGRPWRPRMYTSFNAGGKGHTYVKNRYIIPHRKKEEKETRFVGSTYKENPYPNAEYVQYLESLEGDLGRAWREGDWDMFAGQYFDEWNWELHVVPPRPINPYWKKFRSIDPSGRSGTTAAHWYAVDNDGTVWVYREHAKTGMDADEHAKAIKEMSVDAEGVEEHYPYTVIDSSVFAKAGFNETMAEIYMRKGINDLMPADKGRVVGWNAVHTYLRHNAAQPEPKIKIFNTCTKLIEQIPTAQHDEHNPDDVADMRQGADHLDALDSLRYFLQSLREYQSPRPENAIQRRLRRQHGWSGPAIDEL